jgi:predicted DNA-binding transcriptional regulator AlpA
MDTYTPHQADLFPPEVVHLLGTARQLIDRHINDGGICAECGLSWPCQRAQLAELTLGTL